MTYNITKTDKQSTTRVSVMWSTLTLFARGYVSAAYFKHDHYNNDLQSTIAYRWEQLDYANRRKCSMALEKFFIRYNDQLHTITHLLPPNTPVKYNAYQAGADLFNCNFGSRVCWVSNTTLANISHDNPIAIEINAYNEALRKLHKASLKFAGKHILML